MRKTLIVMSLLAMIPTAEAAQRYAVPNRSIPQHYAPRYVPRYVVPQRRVIPRYVAPRYPAQRYVAPRRDWVPGVVLGLGAAAALGTLYNTTPECWREPVLDVYGRQAYDAYGLPMIDTVCH